MASVPLKKGPDRSRNRENDIVAARDDYLLDSLVEMGYVTNEQLVPIRAEADSTGEGVVDTLVTKGMLSPAVVAQAKATHFGAEFIHLRDLTQADDVIAAVPRHVEWKKDEWSDP